MTTTIKSERQLSGAASRGTAFSRLVNRIVCTRLYANTFSLVLNSAFNSLLGFFFWVVVARFYTTEDLGIGSAITSAGALLSFAATLGLGMGLIRYLPAAKSGGVALTNSCFTLSSVAAVLAAVVFLLGIPLWSPALAPVRADVRFGVAFVVFVVIGTLHGLLNEVYVALRRAEYSLIQGAVMGLLKLLLVAVMAGFFKVFGIVVSWTAATVFAVGLGVLVFLPRLQPGYRPVPSLQPQASKEMVRFSLANYVSAGLWNTPAWVLPVMVLGQLGSAANAYFFVGWAMSGLLFAIPAAASTSLFAEGSNLGVCLARDVKRSLRLTAALALPALALLLAVGDKLLLVFGREYSEAAQRLLWVLGPSVLPVSINVMYLAVARVRKSLRDIVVVAAAVAVGTLGLSYLLMPHLGIMGPGVAWLVSQSLVGLVVLPRLIMIIRPGAADETANDPCRAGVGEADPGQPKGRPPQ